MRMKSAFHTIYKQKVFHPCELWRAFSNHPYHKSFWNTQCRQMPFFLSAFFDVYVSTRRVKNIFRMSHTRKVSLRREFFGDVLDNTRCKNWMSIDGRKKSFLFLCVSFREVLVAEKCGRLKYIDRNQRFFLHGYERAFGDDRK